MVSGKEYELKDVLSEEDIQLILKELVPNEDYKLVDAKVKTANEKVIGFLGEHLKASLQIQTQEGNRLLHIFIKRVPLKKDGRTTFIEDKNFFNRESLVLNICKEFDRADGQKICCCKALLCNENMIVMPDLMVDGYKICPQTNYLDFKHTLVAAASVARFHANYANYETLKSVIAKQPYTILQDYNEMMKEVFHEDSPWFEAAVKTALSFIQEFSKKINKIDDIEEKFYKMMLKSCDLLREYKDSLNVLLHKDLWTNNIMFKYTNDQPTNAVLVDFQLARYGPPAFDVMSMLYLNTSRSLREQHEEEVFKHYFSTFLESVNSSTTERLNKLKYDYDHFRKWCDLSRIYGCMTAVCNLPYIAMDGAAAQESLGDPDKFAEYMDQDRAKLISGYAKQNSEYKQRLLETYEEFIEKFVVQ